MKNKYCIFIIVAMIITCTAYAGEVYYEETFNSQSMSAWKSYDLDHLILDSAAIEELNSLGINVIDGKFGWDIGKFEDEPENFAAFSTSYLNPIGTTNDWLISPEIEIGESAFIQWQSKSLSSTYPDSYIVYISTSGSEVSDFTTPITSSINERSITWATKSVDLSKLGYKNQKIRIAFQNITTDGMVLAIDNIKAWVPFEYDLSVFSVIIPESIHKQKTDVPIQFWLKNLGAKEITSFDVSYQFDGDEPISAHIEDISILPDSFQIFTHPVIWEPTRADMRTVKVTVSNINGSEENDERPGNNSKTAKIFVWDSTNSKPIFPLFEEFASSTCDSCAELHKVLTPLLENNKERMTLIKYAMSEPGSGDKYYHPYCISRRSYYLNGLSNQFEFPLAFANGELFSLAPENLTQSVLDTIYNQPSFFDIINPEYSIVDSIIEFKTDVKSFADFTGSYIGVYAAVVELTSTGNASTNGEIEFYNVMKAFMTTYDGETITILGKDSIQNIVKTRSIKNNMSIEDHNDLAVVVWVQNRYSKKVLASAWAVRTNVSVPYQNDGNGIVAVFPNPANDYAAVRYAVKGDKAVSFEIYSTDGKLLVSKDNGILSEGYYVENFILDGFNSGQYLIKLKIGERVFTEKLNVVK